MPTPLTEIFASPTGAELQQFRTQQTLQLQRLMLKVLIVEDQLFSSQLLYEVLRGVYMVECAENLKDAWRLFIEHMPDIIFLDIQLADGNGHALAQHIKVLAPATHVVMVTANYDADNIAQARQNHADGFIAKPFTNQRIQACLDQYLAARPAILAKGNSHETTH